MKKIMIFVLFLISFQLNCDFNHAGGVIPGQDLYQNDFFGKDLQFDHVQNNNILHVSDNAPDQQKYYYVNLEKKLPLDRLNVASDRLIDNLSGNKQKNQDVVKKNPSDVQRVDVINPIITSETEVNIPAKDFETFKFDILKKYQTMIIGWDVAHWSMDFAKNSDVQTFANALDQDKLEPQQAISILQQLVQINSQNLKVQHVLIMITDIFIKKVMQAQNITADVQQKTHAEKTFHDYLYTKKEDHMSPQSSADFNTNRLIEESYVTPAMQKPIFAVFKQPFVINKITGAPYFGQKQNMPTVEMIIDQIDISNISEVSKENGIKALESASLAVDIATVVAGLEATYDINNQDYYWYQEADANLTKFLNIKKQRVQTALGKLKSAKITQKDAPFVYEVAPMEDKDLLMLSEEEIINVIKLEEDLRDSKDVFKINDAANLLFKQCFIAQQHHLKDKSLFDKMNSIKKEIEQGDYIFTHFPTMDQFVATIRSVKPLSVQHILFTHVRQAVQTALFIAKCNSTYYLTTDPLIEKLKNMDTKAREHCENPLYGATPEDINRNAISSAIMSTLMSVAIIGATVIGANISSFLYKEIEDALDSYGKAKYWKSYAVGTYNSITTALQSSSTWDEFLKESQLTMNAF